MTNTIPWSNVIRERRIKFLGHILRQKEVTPAREALQETMKPIKRKIGRPKQTWWALVKKELESCDTNPDIKWLTSIAQNRKEWTKIAKRVMSNFHDV